MTLFLRKLSQSGKQIERLIYRIITESWIWRKSSLLRQVLRWFNRLIPRTSRRSVTKKRVDLVVHDIYQCGFYERGISDLQTMAAQTNKTFLRKVASWELAMWYVNKNGQEGASKFLELFPAAMEGEIDAKRYRHLRVLEAECLQALGKVEAAKDMISRTLQSQADINLFFCAANLESSLPDRLEWINKGLNIYDIAPIGLDPSLDASPYERLIPGPLAMGSIHWPQDAPLVSVIVPAYNRANMIHIALDSLLSQTWTRLEVLVVDDCSTDATREVVEEYSRKDPRIKLLRAEKNGGAYAARNLALSAASGDLVTCHDSDDWSHPQKIERQVFHLLQNPSIIANTSDLVRVTSDLKIYRRGKPGYFLISNASSHMFRRIPVMEAIGFWDTVRFSADSEFQKRIKIVFGNRAQKDLKSGPLSFTLWSVDSLTGSEAFGFHGYRMGARKEYYDAYIYHHKTANNLRYDFPQTSRPFAVPEPLWPVREPKPSGRRHFDVIIASDFRLPSGVTRSVIEEIKAQKQSGLRTGLIQMSCYGVNKETINPRVRDLLDGDQVQMLVFGEQLSCDLLFLRVPSILQESQHFIPDIDAGNVHVIIDQLPMSTYGPEGVPRYEFSRCANHLLDYFGKSGIWHPGNPLIRKALFEHHAEELSAITLADQNWMNIIDVNEWRRMSRPTPCPKIRIGRYSNDHINKWPPNLKDLLAVYPVSSLYEVHVLGGAEVPKMMLQRLPKNWHVIGPGEMLPKDFLAMLDVFVYFTHPDLVENFENVILEAMAVGVPVILPHWFSEVFKEAAIYAQPFEVKEKIDCLMGNVDSYQLQVEKAYEYLSNNFGYSNHDRRIRNLIRS